MKTSAHPMSIDVHHIQTPVAGVRVMLTPATAQSDETQPRGTVAEVVASISVESPAAVAPSARGT